MWRHYVYVHRRADDGQVFYVGKGTERPRHKRPLHERAVSRDARSQWWHRVVAKHGRIAEVVASFVDDVAAQEFEKALIARYGRRSLVNLTDGGDGHSGIAISDELRARRRANASKPRTVAWIQSIRRARANGGNGGVVKRGDRLPETWRRSIAATKLGERNPMHGRTGEKHPNGRRVVDSATGTTYPTVTSAALARGVRLQTLHNMLTGFRPNTTSMRFA